MKEILSLRTKTSRTYDLGGGKRRIVIDPTLTVQPSAKDAMIHEGAPTNNYGGTNNVQVYDYPENSIRSLLEFDISGLPAATLDAASLQLYFYQWYDYDPVGKTVWAYKLTRTNWVELEATWDIYKTGSSWTTAGGDYVTANPAGGSTTFPADKLAWMTWNVLAIVQDAYDGSIAAEFLLKYETEQVPKPGYSECLWHSKDYTGDDSLRPKLVIDYTPAYTVHEKVVSDGIALTDTLVKTPMLFKSDGIAVADVLVKTPIKTLVDGIAFKDILVKLIDKRLTDAIAFKDILVKTISKTLTDAIAFKDVISYVKNPTKLAKLIRKLLQLEDIGGGKED
ncbi:hypothetical protein ES708_28972 [subsurface metagenome]